MYLDQESSTLIKTKEIYSVVKMLLGIEIQLIHIFFKYEWVVLRHIFYCHLIAAVNHKIQEKPCVPPNV